MGIICCNKDEENKIELLKHTDTMDTGTSPNKKIEDGDDIFLRKSWLTSEESFILKRSICLAYD